MNYYGYAIILILSYTEYEIDIIKILRSEMSLIEVMCPILYKFDELFS